MDEKELIAKTHRYITEIQSNSLASDRNTHWQQIDVSNAYTDGYKEGQNNWRKLAEIAPPEEWLRMYEVNREELSKARKEGDEWSKLRSIATPEKWMEMYEQYQNLLGLYNSGKDIADEELKAKILKLRKYVNTCWDRSRNDIANACYYDVLQEIDKMFKDNPNTKIG